MRVNKNLALCVQVILSLLISLAENNSESERLWLKTKLLITSSWKQLSLESLSYFSLYFKFKPQFSGFWILYRESNIFVECQSNMIRKRSSMNPTAQQILVKALNFFLITVLFLDGPRLYHSITVSVSLSIIRERFSPGS